MFGLWCLYVVIHYFSHSTTLVFTIYSVTLFLLLLRATTLFSSPNFKFKLFFIGIAGIASLESLYCISQFLGFFTSESKSFAVTGSWNNPNVTAIFLALTIPVFLYLFREQYKKIVWIGFISVLVAVLLLKCRAAFIGSILSLIVFYGLEHHFMAWVKNKKNRSAAKALLILCLLIIVPISSHLYNAKKASADGRKFIWKLSAQMATQKPLTGYGYGSFEKEYNLYQAHYIQNGKATTDELANAGPVIMPHNEVLLHTVEGGIVGLILIGLFFGSLLWFIKPTNRNDEKEPITVFYPTKNSRFHLAYSGLIGFLGMSMVNSTFQIVPIMGLLTIYAALICSESKAITIPKFLSFLSTKYAAWTTTILSLGLCAFLIYKVVAIAQADRINNLNSELTDSASRQKALLVIPALAANLGHDSHYWLNYGQLLYKENQLEEALICFKKAQSLSSLPEIYHHTARCYKKLGQYQNAIKEYETLSALYPPKFLYKMLLLKMYLKTNDQVKARALAKEVIALKPKKPSDKVNRYKEMCRNMLGQIPSPALSKERK